jgi:hypothetical protein
MSVAFCISEESLIARVVIVVLSLWYIYYRTFIAVLSITGVVMHVIVYTSELATPEVDIKKLLLAIVEQAKANNPRLGITGLLFYHNLRFLQIIEGEKEALHQLMAVIQKDPRHKNVVRIIDDDIYKKSFEQWNMDYLNLSDNDTIDIEELEVIRDVYKKTMTADTGMLAYFYKAMLESHELGNSKK